MVKKRGKKGVGESEIRRFQQPLLHITRPLTPTERDIRKS